MSNTLTETPSSYSPETQHLIELCLAVHSGDGESLGVLRQAAEVRAQQMNAAMDQFFGEMDAEGPEFYQEFRHHFEGIEGQFRHYGAALEQIAENDDVDFREIATALSLASEGLRVGMAIYQEAYLSRGASPYPIVNLFDNIAKALREETTSHEAWIQTCARYTHVYTSALEEIDQSQAKNKPGVAERRSAIVTILDCLRQFQEFDHARPKSDLDEILAGFSTAHFTLSGALDTYHHSEFSEGPAKGQKFNWIIKAAEGVLSGQYQPNVLGALAQDVLDTTQANLNELKALSKNKLESATLTEQLSEMLAAAEGIEDALSFLVDFAEGSGVSEAEVREVLAELIESGDSLVDATELVTQYNQNAGKVTCVQCQESQDIGGRSCVKCGAQLPMQPDAGVYSHSQTSSFQVLEGDPEDVMRDDIMTDVMKALFDKCEAVMAGSMDFDEFSLHLDKSLRDIDLAEKKLSELALPEMPPEANAQEQKLSQEFLNLGHDALGLLSLGVEHCRNGLDSMREGAAADDPETIRQGMRDYYEGTQKMWQVRRLDHQLTKYIDGEEVEHEPDTTETVTLSDD